MKEIKKIPGKKLRVACYQQVAENRVRVEKKLIINAAPFFKEKSLIINARNGKELKFQRSCMEKRRKERKKTREREIEIEIERKKVSINIAKIV